MDKLSELSKPVATVDVQRGRPDGNMFCVAWSSAGHALPDGPHFIYSQEYVSALTQRIAELEASETQLIQERDSAEQALADMYEAATGERPEWSNWFGFADAVEEVAQVGAKLATPVRLPTALFCPEEYAGSLLWSETEAYNKAISKCAEGIRAAGLKVEGMSR